MRAKPDGDGVVLVAYGDEEYHDEWKALFEKVGAELEAKTGIDCVEYTWCGHPVRFKSEQTERTIRKVLETKERVLVVPVLVAVDEMLQGGVIGGAIEKVGQAERIVYRHDAVLPDENIERWIVEASLEIAAKLSDERD